MELFWTVGLKNILYNIHNIPNILYHLKYIIDSHKTVVRKVSQVDLKAIFASRGELVDIFQAYHSFTWRSLVEGWLGILGRDIFCAFSSSFCTDKNNSVWPRSRFARLKKKWRKYVHRHCLCHFIFFHFCQGITFWLKASFIFSKCLVEIVDRVKLSQSAKKWSRYIVRSSTKKLPKALMNLVTTSTDERNCETCMICKNDNIWHVYYISVWEPQNI